MRSCSEIETIIRGIKPNISKKYNVLKIGYFGSYAKNSAKEHSDLDVLVEFKKPIGWAFFDLKQLLQDELGLEIDLVSKKALKKPLEKKILSEVIYI